MAINGNNIFIKRDGTLIAGTRSNDLTTTADMIETATPATGLWKQYRAGRKAWTVNTSYLLMAETAFTEMLSVGTTYTIAIAARNATDLLQGTAILTQCKITATRGNLAVGTFTFQGTGALVQA